MPRIFRVLTLLATVSAASAACATKGFLKGQVGSVNEKVDSLSRAVEETQERTRKNETRIVQVDEKTDRAGLWAKDAGSSAATAQNMADAARTKAEMAQAKADAADRAAKRIMFDIILSEDEGNFQFGKAELPGATRTRIDQLIEQLKANPRAAFVEVEGHTDDVGSTQVNNRLGLARAEAVKRYLYEKHQVPLHKINVISYGKAKPIAPNDTPDGRARNRRVVIKVLA